MEREKERERERERGGGGVGVKEVHRRPPQIYQLLLSRVIDVKYGCFTFFFIIKRALFGLACVACLAAQGDTRSGEEDSSFFSLIVRPRHFFFCPPTPPPPKKKMAPATQSMIGYSSKFMRVSTEWTYRRRTSGRRDKGSFVLHWFFYNEFEDVQEKAPTKVPNHDKFVDAQTTLWASLTIRRTNGAPGQLTIAHALLPGYHCSLLSFGACQSDGMLQNWL